MPSRGRIVAAFLVMVLTMVIAYPTFAAPDDLVGRWERFGDGAEGTRVRVEKKGNVYQAVSEKVTGTLVSLGFAKGEVKWKDVVYTSGTSYSGKDLFKFEGNAGQEYRNAVFMIDQHGILRVSVSTDPNSVTIIGQYQTWRKLPDAKKISLKIGSPVMTVNGAQKEIDPGKGTSAILQSGRTLIPIRAIAEELGATVDWLASESKVTVKLGSKVVELWIGKNATRVNGKSGTTDVAPQIVNARTMVPLRFVTENLDCTVSWDGATSTVTIEN